VSAPDRSFDAIVIGAGHNGLVAGGLLARAGLQTLVLERRDRPGGVAELALTMGRLRPTVMRDLQLEQHGLRLIAPSVRAFAPQPDGRALTLWADSGRTADELRGWSKADAQAYVGFDRKVRALASFIAHLNAATPPDLRAPSVADALTGLDLVRAFRGLGGRRQVGEALRVLPMPVAEFLGEAFETDAVRGAIAARAVRCSAMGPRSAGTTLTLLSDSSGSGGGAAGDAAFVRGGALALGDALVKACLSFGGSVRCGAQVAQILIRDGRVEGVALASGEELTASLVLSAVDPKRTLLGMVDPVALGPTLVWRAGRIRMPGTVAAVELELGALPRFSAADAGGDEQLRGRIVIAPGIDYLERAFDASKYGRVSEEPYLEAVIPTLADPSLAPGGGHVVRGLLQYAPYHLRRGDWDSLRDGLGDLALTTLERYAPDIRSKVTALKVLTPLDLERDYGLTEGHPLHGEPGLDQFFAWRPLLGLARYRLPWEGLYLCGSGAHPGGGVTGGPGENAAREALADWKRRTY
jgi:phytoene dehydrogenase-like protein